MFQQLYIVILIYDFVMDCYVDCNEVVCCFYGFEKVEDLCGCMVLLILVLMQVYGLIEKVLGSGWCNLLGSGKELLSFEWQYCWFDGIDWIVECCGIIFCYCGRMLIQFMLIDVIVVKEVCCWVDEMVVFLQVMIDCMFNMVYYKGLDM